MKFICTILIIILFTNVYGNDVTYNHLKAINKCWTEQRDYPPLPICNISEDKDWIQLHLSMVEQTLRNRSVMNLDANQKENRLRALDYLHSYWLQGNFPVNDKYAGRTPIFIDDYNNFCAVGYLIMATGHEDISRMIASKTNLAYVREMHYPELNAWAKEYGFTVDELAWIQPGYDPQAYPGRGTASIGGGTNGEVMELTPNETDDTLFVGGRFSIVDNNIAANNIAYLTKNNESYQWHNLGSGVEGEVYAIEQFQGKLFVGGNITVAGDSPVTNIAYWDGISWHDAGCIFGVVKDLIVHNNELYAVGDFDVCASLSEVNVAKWNGSSMWSQMPPLDGHVNTVASYKGDLIFGGRFAWMNDTVNIIKWKEGSGYEFYLNNIQSEVMDIGVFRDSLYAVCKRTSPADTNLIYKLQEQSWVGVTDRTDGIGSSRQFNTFCVQKDTVLLGGHFGSADANIYANNCISLFFEASVPPADGNWFVVDSAINKMVVFNNDVIIGGKFKMGRNMYIAKPDATLNGIARKIYRGTVGINDVTKEESHFIIMPNPANAASKLKIESNMDAGKLEIMSMEGRLINTYKLSAKHSEIRLPDLTSGAYLLLLTDDKGMKFGQKLIVK